MAASDPTDAGRQHVGALCWLNGRPATIIGRRLPFATVVSETRRIEYAWQTIAHVMSEGGRFSA